MHYEWAVHTATYGNYIRVIFFSPNLIHIVSGRKLRMCCKHYDLVCKFPRCEIDWSRKSNIVGFIHVRVAWMFTFSDCENILYFLCAQTCTIISMVWNINWVHFFVNKKFSWKNSNRQRKTFINLFEKKKNRVSQFDHKINTRFVCCFCSIRSFYWNYCNSTLKFIKNEQFYLIKKKWAT